MRPCRVPLVVLMLVAGIGSAAAEPLCRTGLADGRVVLSEPFHGVNGLSCPSATAPLMRPEAGINTVPSMRFTTGPIGPFTTGSLPPVTGGSLPPLTTFSNSPPAAANRR
jgi:hypothetical protein